MANISNRANRPASVTSAVKLLYATFGIGIFRSVLEYQTLVQSVPAEFIFSVWVFVTVIMLSLIYNIGRGRNWARIIFLALFAIGVPFSIQPLLQSIAGNPVSGLLGIVQMVGQIVAVVFLFQSSANHWFRPPKNPEKRSTESVEF